MKPESINTLFGSDISIGHGDIDASAVDKFGVALDESLSASVIAHGAPLSQDIAELEALDDAWIDFVARFQEYKSSADGADALLASQSLAQSWKNFQVNISEFESKLPFLQSYDPTSGEK